MLTNFSLTNPPPFFPIFPKVFVFIKHNMKLVVSNVNVISHLGHCTRRALRRPRQSSCCRSQVLWSEMSQSMSAQRQVQISAQDFSLQWGCFCKSPVIWLLLSILLRDWSKNGLEQRLAAVRASNVVTSTDPQKKPSSHCARKQFQQGCCSCKTRSQFEQEWTQSPSSSQCWRTAGFRAGSEFYSPGLTSDLPVKKGLDWFILSLCESQHHSGGALRRHVAHSQPVLQPVCGPGKATWLRG